MQQHVNILAGIEGQSYLDLEPARTLVEFIFDKGANLGGGPRAWGRSIHSSCEAVKSGNGISESGV
jgi:hypothetical protein